MTTRDLVSAIETAVAEVESGWALGLRVVGEESEAEIGLVLEPSRRWDDGEPTEDLLRGTSAIDLSGGVAAALAALRGYVGAKLVLVAGERCGSGDDEYETIIRDATVVAAWDW